MIAVPSCAALIAGTTTSCCTMMATVRMSLLSPLSLPQFVPNVATTSEGLLLEGQAKALLSSHASAGIVMRCCAVRSVGLSTSWLLTRLMEVVHDRQPHGDWPGVLLLQPQRSWRSEARTQRFGARCFKRDWTLASLSGSTRKKKCINVHIQIICIYVYVGVSICMHGCMCVGMICMYVCMNV